MHKRLLYLTTAAARPHGDFSERTGATLAIEWYVNRSILLGYT